MACSYSDVATSDDLSNPLLHHSWKSDNGKEKEGSHHVMDIDKSNYQTRHRGSANEKENEETDDIVLDMGESNDQTRNRRSDNEKGRKGEKSSHQYDLKHNFNKPTLVSIGPKYVFGEESFKGDVQFKNDEEYKDKYFQSFLERGVEYHEYEKCLKQDPNLMEEARNYYKNIGVTCCPRCDDELVKMLLTDGGFVVEYVLKCKEGGSDDPRIKGKGKEARKDMLRFQNQLPFHVLTTLYQKMIDHTKEAEAEAPSFITLVKFAFASLAPNITLFNLFEDKKPENPLDILHVVHSLCLPIKESRIVVNDFENEWPTVLHINRATELGDVGVRFSNTGKVYTMPKEYGKFSSLKERMRSDKHTSLFDVTFSGGVMNIPSFKVDHFTEIFFRNMIALEQRCRLPTKFYTDYSRLMDHLVDRNEDVSLLRKIGTIHNLLGDDQKVTNMFNNVSVQADISTNFYFAPVYKGVNRHCRNKRLVWMATLKNSYFSDPWKGISTIFGVIVLVLGAALTLKSLLS